MKRPQFNSRSLLSIVMLLIALVGSKGFAQPSGGEIGGAGGGIPNNNPVFAVVDFDDSGDIVGAYVTGLGVFDGLNAELQLLGALSAVLTPSQFSDFTADLTASSNFAVVELAGFPATETTIGYFDLTNGGSWNGFSSQSQLAYQRAATFAAELSNSGITGSTAYNAIASMLLGKNGGRHSTFSNVIIVVDSNGTTHYPTDGNGLIDVLEDIRDDEETVVTLIIKGHGSEELIEVGNGGDILTVVDHEHIVIGNTDPNEPVHDITDLLDDVTDSGTTINLRGCSTAPLAASVDTLIGGDPTTTGTLLPVVNVPWTPFYVGPYYSF